MDEEQRLGYLNNSHHHQHHDVFPLSFLQYPINIIDEESGRRLLEEDEEEQNNNRFFFFSIEDLAYYFLTLFFLLILSFYLFFFASMILEQVFKGQLNIELPFPILGRDNPTKEHILIGDGPVTSVCNLDYKDSNIFLCSFISENEKPINCHTFPIHYSNHSSIVPCILFNRDQNIPKIQSGFEIKLNFTKKDRIYNDNTIKLSIINHLANDVVDEENILNHLVEFILFFISFAFIILVFTKN
ncbi:hypothetical protein DFA_10264 [Cavenderia fasciculata]|uniref:Transmembrane protein n=1 Tax=Cavenderia fasciculata TaxID=261658 RepID=F4Q9R0_CACFS|nr:uncharacterized protein DFA_10264 [Cavenderia fasciculata]EGG15429.1 hypothetical protein DFA_10264 [Cavenderia fasciculata]|eukprot:XP_004354171.1 hypothetical protein DFA_10264 [Cavenderia fasciculata]